ncbi:hypothetical protein STEG23_019684 [Scotinomys teguina]
MFRKYPKQHRPSSLLLVVYQNLMCRYSPALPEDDGSIPSTHTAAHNHRTYRWSEHDAALLSFWFLPLRSEEENDAHVDSESVILLEFSQDGRGERWRLGDSSAEMTMDHSKKSERETEREKEKAVGKGVESPESVDVRSSSDKTQQQSPGESEFQKCCLDTYCVQGTGNGFCQNCKDMLPPTTTTKTT